MAAASVSDPAGPRRGRPVLGHFVVVAIVSCVVALGSSLVASACSCAPLTEAEALEAADAVFVGSATAVDDSQEYDDDFVVRYTMQVDEVYRGSAFEVQSLVTPPRGGTCGLELELGVDWVIFATRPGSVDDTLIDDSELASNLCSLSRPFEDASLAASLGSGEQPVEGTSAMSGDGDDGGGIPGLVFGLGFVAFGLAVAGGGAWYTQRRRITE